MTRVARRTHNAFAVGIALVVVATGCAPKDPSKRVVAEVGDRPVTLAQVQTYLDANLLQDPSAEAPSPADLDRVKSRLLDDYLDEELQLGEAIRRGVVVTEQELTDYLGGDAPADPARRELAHRELTIQKLRESIVRAGVHVEDAQVDAWIVAHPQTEPAALHPQETLDEDDDFLALGTEVWEYEVADGREQEFIEALENSRMVLDYEQLDDVLGA